MALELLEDMRALDLVPTASCYSAAAAATARGGDWKVTLSILDDMQTDGLDPTLMTYNAAIRVRVRYTVCMCTCFKHERHCVPVVSC